VEKKTKMLKEELHKEHNKMVLSKTNGSSQKAVWYCCCFRKMNAPDTVALQVMYM
jgi:hypothetical protein